MRGEEMARIALGVAVQEMRAARSPKTLTLRASQGLGMSKTGFVFGIEITVLAEVPQDTVDQNRSRLQDRIQYASHRYSP